MLTLVPTPIGNLEDISSRAIKALMEAELIFCEDTRVTKKLLHLFEERNTLNFPCEDFRSLHSHNEEQVISTLTPDFFDQNVVYVSDAGMPCISDPGAKLVAYCLNNQIEYDVLPGANAVLTAFAMSGFEGPEFTFYGFLAHKGPQRAAKLNELMQSAITPILYESPHRLVKTLEELNKIDPNRVVFLAKELTKKFQKVYKAPAKELYEKLKKESIKGEWVIVIEPVSFEGEHLTLEDINPLDLPPKVKAKLLAKLTGKKVKAIYQELLNS